MLRPAPCICQCPIFLTPCVWSCPTGSGTNLTIGYCKILWLYWLNCGHVPAKTIPSSWSLLMARGTDMRIATQFLIVLALSGYRVVVKSFVYYTIKLDSRERAKYKLCCLACTGMLRAKKYRWQENICAAALTKDRIEAEDRRRLLSRGHEM